MKVREFISEHMGDVNSLEIRTYVPIMEKSQTINTWIEKMVMDDTGTYNSIMADVVESMSVIDLYTDLEIESLDDYDLLCESGVLMKILDELGSRYQEYNQMFYARLRDYEHSTNSISGILNQVIKMFESIDMEKMTNVIDAVMKDG